MRIIRNVLGAGLALTSGALLLQPVLALTYQHSLQIEFNFEPMLAVSLSASDLLIDNLTPGSSDHSNTITVNVETNNMTGYTLAAKVGNGTTYQNDRLVNTTNSSSYFYNLTSSATLSNFPDNRWGYALGAVNNSTVYSGLVYNTDTTINATTNAAGTAATGYTGTGNTNFTIAAKAANTLSAGDYKNVIIFTVVGNQPPISPQLNHLMLITRLYYRGIRGGGLESSYNDPEWEIDPNEIEVGEVGITAGVPIRCVARQN